MIVSIRAMVLIIFAMLFFNSNIIYAESTTNLNSVSSSSLNIGKKIKKNKKNQQQNNSTYKRDKNLKNKSISKKKKNIILNVEPIIEVMPVATKPVATQIVPATTTVITPKSEVLNINNKYQPYLQVSSVHLFRSLASNNGITGDLFIPVWQDDSHNNIIFTELRYLDASYELEGGAYFGYRHLTIDGNKEFGIYGAFDRKGTQFSKYFNQIMFGGECWIENWYINANFYQPIGKKQQYVKTIVGTTGTNTYYDKVQPGIDAGVGYEFIEGLTGYIGGYYFAADGIPTASGPRAKLFYDWAPSSGRIFGIFDKVGLEANIQNDRPSGMTGHISINLRIGWLLDRKSTLTGLARHMIDPIRNDINALHDFLHDPFNPSDSQQRTPKENLKLNNQLRSPKRGVWAHVEVDEQKQ